MKIVYELSLLAKIGLRQVFPIRKYPIGIDRFLNTYYDNGFLRKVNKKNELGLIPTFVDKKYSDWLSYKNDSFPKLDLEFRLQNFKINSQFDLVQRLAFKEINKDSLVYDPYLSARLVQKKLI